MSGTIWPVDAVSGAPSFTGRMLRETASVLMAGATSARPFGGISGVRPGTSPTIGSAPTTTTWQVTPFGGLIDGEASNLAAPYQYAFPANQTGTIAAQTGTARSDRLDVQVADPAEGDVSGPSINVVYTQGPGGAGVLPSAPPRSHPLYTINVPVSGGGSPTLTWVAWVTSAAGGFLQAETLQQLNSITGWRTGVLAQVFADGTAANNVTYRWNGSAWKPWESDWISYTPTITNLAAGNGVYNARYKYRQGVVVVEGSFLYGTTSGIAGALQITHPLTVDTLGSAVGFPLGSFTFLNTGSAQFEGLISGVSSTKADIYALNVSGTYLQQATTGTAVPFTPTAGGANATSYTWRYEFTPA